MKSQKYRPYVRLANGKEQANSFRDAFRLAYYQQRGKPFYVMVQRGFPSLVIGVGPSKREVQRSPVLVRFGITSFQQWSKNIRDMARGANGNAKPTVRNARTKAGETSEAKAEQGVAAAG